MTSMNSLWHNAADLTTETPPSILGGKGWGIVDLMNATTRPELAHVSVPDAVIITTQAWREYNDIPAYARAQFVRELVQDIIQNSDFVGPHCEDLVSVRSGAPISMPGMMDTFLNVGINFDNVETYAQKWGNRAAYKTLARCACQYTGIEFKPEANIMAQLAEAKEHLLIDDLDGQIAIASDLNIESAITSAVIAVFRSWDSDRAIEYRKVHNIDRSIGTAVVIQKMVMGHLNAMSGTGVMFTRDPSDGQNGVRGEFLLQAQGEDVVSGKVTPLGLQELAETALDKEHDITSQLLRVAEVLENERREMLDIEFTVEDGKLYLLQVRTGKRTAKASIKIARDMFTEGLITLQQALDRISLENITQVESGQFEIKGKPLTKGIPAGAGVAAGIAVMSSAEAVTLGADKPVILIAKETTPDDFPGMVASAGVLTLTGGLTSHAAVVARSLNKPTVVGCPDAADIEPGTPVAINAATGEVWVGPPVEEATLSDGHVSRDLDDLLIALQKETGELVEADYYRPCSVVRVADMGKADFLSMVVAIQKKGPLYRTVFDMGDGVTVSTGDLPFDHLAHLAATKQLDREDVMKPFIDEGKIIVVGGSYKVKATPAAVLAMEDSDGIVDVDTAGWTQFLGKELAEKTWGEVREKFNKVTFRNEVLTRAEFINKLWSK